MSIRESKYNMSKNEYRQICDYCRSDKFDQKDLLIECAVESNSSIAGYLVESIIYSLSYEKISGKHYIPINKNDFYAYRRKCISIFKNRIKISYKDKFIQCISCRNMELCDPQNRNLKEKNIDESCKEYVEDKEKKEKALIWWDKLGL